jgi:hypothetical protein
MPMQPMILKRNLDQNQMYIVVNKLIICTMPMQPMILKRNLDQNQMIFRAVSFLLLCFLACF